MADIRLARPKFTHRLASAGSDRCGWLKSSACSQDVALRAQRSFAPEALHLLHSYYDLSASPEASYQLRFVGSLVSLRSLDHLLLVFGTFPTLLARESFPGCLDPYPGSLWGASARFFPQSIGLP